MKAMRVMNVRAQQGISSRRHTTRMMAAQQGTLMRSFTLPSTKGGNTKVPAKNGSVVFFFNKSDTPGCKAEADTFDELYGEFKKKGIQVVGISMEDVDALKKSNEGRKVELLSDADGAVSEQFDSELKIPLIGAKLGFSARNTFLLSNKGEVLSVWQEGKSMGNVKNGKHAQQVLDSVEENIKSSNPLAVLFS
ncbi:thioredoxin domain-containing protein [Chloropicon primus]|nr:hypothetical protein A3770_12p65030 [Chloropicon primus]UPR03196.1 thioredoxin domain-containing protein [Chloropicon primus]|eukprot:QDZ23985.1 hypothetical protein A3770_12p65030 [Chloropicon primus]